MSIIALFCEIDDFFLAYEKWQATHCLPKETPPETRGCPRKLHPSEVMTLLIAFHESGYRTLKHFYQKHVCVYWRGEFPHLVSYSRFVQLQEEVLTLLTLYLSAHLGTCSGISFVDSTRLRSAITSGFPRIASLRQQRNARKHLWGGSMVLNFIY